MVTSITTHSFADAGGGGDSKKRKSGTGVKQSEVVNWLKSNLGQSYDVDGAYGAQCADLPAHVFKKFFNHSGMGNGVDYGRSVPLPPGSKRVSLSSTDPQPGDILSWAGGGAHPVYGHVNFVIGYDKESKIIHTVDQNITDPSGGGGPMTRAKYNRGTLEGAGCMIVRLDMDMDLPDSYSVDDMPEGSSSGGGGGGSAAAALAALNVMLTKILERRKDGYEGRKFSRADVDELDIKTDAARNLFELHEVDPEYTPTSTGLNVLGVSAASFAASGGGARSGTKLALDVATYGDDGLRIMGMPLRFSPLDDPSSRVYNNTFESDLPIVFIQPGKPKVNKKLFGSAAEGGWLSLGSPFFNKAGNAVVRTVGEVIPGGTAIFGDFRDNRYMSFKSTFSEYEAYVNAMLVQLHATMGLGGMFSLTNFTNSDKYGLAFYSSRGTTVSESANNDYSMSEIAREANDKQAQIREKKAAADVGGADIISMMSNWFGDLMKAAADIPVIGGIIGSLTQNLDGSMLYYPDKWDNSTFDRSYSVEFKFYSPYGDPESIFYLVYMPFLCVLGLGLPLQDSYYSYGQPFIVKMSSPGYFECEMGIIRSMSIERGTDNTWTTEGLPREITIRLTVTDMYPQLMLSKNSGHMKYNYGLASYIDCLAGIRYDQLKFLDKLGKKIKVGATRAVSVLTLRRPRLWFGDKLNDLGSYVDWKVTR